MEWTPQGFLPQGLNQPPRTQYALSEAAAAYSAPRSELQGDRRALWPSAGRGAWDGGLKAGCFHWSETSLMMQVFLALRDRGVVGQSGRKEDILSPIRGAGI